MRRVILDLLRCPKCRKGALTPDADTAEVIFGPIHCVACHASFPVGEGVVDLVVDRGEPTGLQRSLEKTLVARSFERYLRPAVQFAISGRRVDGESEFLMYRSLIGKPDAPVLDLGCGTAHFARKLARDPELPPVVGLDVSKAMLEEAVAQNREAGAAIDLVRAEAPYLPFQDGSLGAVLQSGSLHLIEDAARLFMEIGRVLRPGGRYVASTYLPPPLLGTMLHHKAGLYPRGEDELRGGLTAAGLTCFERMVLPPFILVRAEKASAPQRSPRAPLV
ncbi:MAG: methyltransferase domain-containing protein [Myxococcaceae bacterium]